MADDEPITDPDAPTQPGAPLGELMRGVPPAPAGHRAGAQPPPPPPPLPRETVDSTGREQAAFEWAKWAGVELGFLERAFAVVRRVGWLRGSALLVALVLPVVKLVWLPRLIERTAAAVVEGSGLELEVDRWETDLLGDLAVEARDVVLRAPGPYERQELLVVDRARVDLSLVGRLRRGRWVREVSLERGELYLERLLSGRWNLTEVLHAPALRRQLQALDERSGSRPAGEAGGRDVSVADGSCRWHGFACLDRVRVHDLGIEWVENWPGQSGGGLVHTSRVSLHVDDLDGTLQDLRLPLDPRERPSQFVFEGRLADGRFSVEGDGNFFWWHERVTAPFDGRAGAPSSVSQVVAAGAPAAPGGEPTPRLRGLRWSPRGDAQLYLENVGAAALARLVPPAAIRPIGGSITGTLAIVFGEDGYRGEGSVQLDDVLYAANPQSPLLRGRAEEVERALDGLVVDRQVPLVFASSGAEGAPRPIALAQAAVTSEALAGEPGPVAAVALADRLRLSDALAGAGAELLRQELVDLVGEAAAAELGDLAVEALDDGVLAGGSEAVGEDPGRIRRLGRSVKRLFTRGRGSG